MMQTQFIIVIIFLIFGSISNAAGDTLQQVIEQARVKRLASHPYWHFLVHYQPGLFGMGYKSEVHSKEFFLADDGRYEPAAELEATLRALLRPQKGELDSQTKCRFIARYHFLKSHLEWPKEKPVECPGYEKWSFKNHVNSISLIFATGYLGNPASYFGHPLLKFNLSREKHPSKLLDTSLNYGAITPLKENPFVYALKGLFGGYDAGFTHLHFFYNSHNYSETELRDMWEYELDLTPKEVEQIVAHTWELLGMRFSYLFLSNNCASRMAELFENVLQVKLLPRNVPYAIPHTVYERLAVVKRPNGVPFLKAVHHIPSRQTRLTEKFYQLAPGQRDVVRRLADNAIAIEDEVFNKGTNEQKIRLVETLIDYYSFRLIQEPGKKEFLERKQRLLGKRLRLPSIPVKWEETKAKATHLGQRPVLTRIGILENNDLGSGVAIRIRPAYYDLLSPATGRMDYSSLATFDLRLKFVANQISVRQMDFISIDTLNLSRTGLPGDGGLAWNFKLGFDTQDLLCTSCSILRLKAGIGKGIALNPNFVVYALMGGQLQNSVLDSGSVSVTPQLASLYSFSDSWKMYLFLGERTYLNGSKSSQTIVRWQHRFINSKYWDLRFSIEKHVSSETTFAYSYYW